MTQPAGEPDDQALYSEIPDEETPGMTPQAPVFPDRPWLRRTWEWQKWEASQRP